jgi:hypothetical protein
MKLMVAMRSCAVVSLASLVLGQLIIMSLGEHASHGGDFPGFGEARLMFVVYDLSLGLSALAWLAATIPHWIPLSRRRAATASARAELANAVLLAAPPFELSAIFHLRLLLHGW